MLPTWSDGYGKRSDVGSTAGRQSRQLIVRHAPLRHAAVADGAPQPYHLLQG